MPSQRTGPRENRGELLASSHHLRTGLTHLLARFTSEECTEGVGGELWVRGLKHGFSHGYNPGGFVTNCQF